MNTNSSLVRCVVTLVLCLAATGRARAQVGATPQAAPSFACGACFAVTEGGASQYLPLESTEVVLDVRPGLLEAEVIQSFTNRGETALEAIYRYPLPPDAVLTHFELRYRDRVVVSVVREKAAARAAYEAARAEGRKAALLEREDPTVFSTAVANFLPGETVRAVLRFIQPVEMWSDGLEVRFPMVTGRKYFPAHATPGADGNSAAPPEHAVGPAWAAGHVYAFDVQVSGVPVRVIESPSHRIDVSPRGDGSCLVALADEVTVPDRDFVLRVRTPAESTPRPTWLTQRTATGDYGLLAVFPPGAMARTDTTRPRDVLFLLDRSGSMQGTRFASAKEGLDQCLQQLRPVDRFQIVVYSTGHEFYERAWVDAAPAAVTRARDWVAGLQVDGGTELQPALRDSLDAFEPSRCDQVLILLTDGDVGDERSLVTLVERRRRSARVFPIGVGDAPNPYLIRKMAECGRGQARFINDDALLGRELTDLFATLDAPALTDVRVAFLDAAGQVVPHMAFPESLPDTFHARPVQTVVRFTDGVPDRVRIEGVQEGRPFADTVRLTADPVRGDGLEKLFGARWVDDLDDMMRRAQLPAERDAIRQELLDTALQFQLVTELTSRVAIERKPDPAPTTAATQGQSALPLVTVRVPQARVADQGVQVVGTADDEIVVLSEFYVDTETDGGYTSCHTLVGNRLRTDLRDCGANVQVVTREFLEDTGPTTLEDVGGYMAEPLERPDVARAGSGSGRFDGLSVTGLFDLRSVARIAVRSGATAWSDVELRHASSGTRSRMAVRVGDDDYASATATVAGDPSRDGSLPMLAAVSWSRDGDDASSVWLDATRHGSATRTSATLAWRGIDGYGDALFANAAVRAEWGDGVVLEGEFARHDLRRDDPAQFHLDSPANRQSGLGLFNLELLTADTSRLTDTLGQVSAYGSAEFWGARHVLAATSCWLRQDSDWLESVPGGAARRRDTVQAGFDYQLRIADTVVVGLGLDRAHHETPGQTITDEATSREAIEASVRLVRWLDLFGSAGSDEFLSRVPTGWLRLDEGSLVPMSAPVERRESRQVGVRLLFLDERVRAQVAWFEDRARDHSYRDWSWEREHAAGGPVWIDETTLRLPVGTSVWPEHGTSGWAGSVDLNPTRAFTAVGTWRLGRGGDGPYRGGESRASIFGRYEVQQGALRRLSFGLGANWRDDLTFDDGYTLRGGLRWDAMVAYQLRSPRSRGLRVQLNLADLTDVGGQPTRFAPERGRRWILTVAHGF